MDTFFNTDIHARRILRYITDDPVQYGVPMSVVRQVLNLNHDQFVACYRHLYDAALVSTRWRGGMGDCIYPTYRGIKQAKEWHPTRLCASNTCDRTFRAADDLGQQLYCSKPCKNAAGQQRKRARDAAEQWGHPLNRFDNMQKSPLTATIREYTNKENAMPVTNINDTIISRATLALKVMRDETCATKQQQDGFTHLVMILLRNESCTIERFNEKIVDAARSIATEAQAKELEALLVKHQFVKPKPAYIDVLIRLTVEGSKSIGQHGPTSDDGVAIHLEDQLRGLDLHGAKITNAKYLEYEAYTNLPAAKPTAGLAGRGF